MYKRYEWCFYRSSNDIHQQSEIILEIMHHYNLDFIQFQRDFSPQAKSEENFMYIFDKLNLYIFFSYRFKTLDIRSYGHWLETSKECQVST